MLGSASGVLLSAGPVSHSFTLSSIQQYLLCFSSVPGAVLDTGVELRTEFLPWSDVVTPSSRSPTLGRERCREAHKKGHFSPPTGIPRSPWWADSSPLHLQPDARLSRPPSPSTASPGFSPHTSSSVLSPSRRPGVTQAPFRLPPTQPGSKPSQWSEFIFSHCTSMLPASPLGHCSSPESSSLLHTMPGCPGALLGAV